MVTRDHMDLGSSICNLSGVGAAHHFHSRNGTVSAPPGDSSGRVIVEGQSSVSGNRYNIAVAFEHSEHGGRAIAQSTFHHFADYNWDPSAGCPSFVTEPAGDGIVRFPDVLRSTKQYVRNIAFWLGAEQPP